MPAIYGYDHPDNSSSVKRRFKGLKPDTMGFLTDTTAWYTTTPAVNRQDVMMRKPSIGFNDMTAFIAQREALGGQPNALYQARLNVLKITDPMTRTNGLMFLDSLQALPLESQQAALAMLTGHQDEGFMADAEEQLVQGLGLSGSLYVEDGVVHATDQNNRGLKLLTALKVAFPSLHTDMGLDGDQMLDQVLTDISDTMLEPALESNAINSLADTLTNDKYSIAEKWYHTVGALTSGPSEYFWGMAGRAGRAVGAEGIVDDVASAWDNVEQGMSDTMVGYYDPAAAEMVQDPETGKWSLQGGYHLGALNYDLDPTAADFEERTAARAEAFGVVMIFAGGAGGVVGGAVGRRVKSIRGIIGATDDVVKAALPNNIKPKGGTGLLDRAFEGYRAPARWVQAKFDDIAVPRLRISPEEFFKESMFGKLHQSGGAQLISALERAKKMVPGSSQKSIDGQVGFLRERYGTQLPDELIRKMLAAPSVEDAKVAFVDFATNPQGEVVISQLNKKLAKARASLETTTRQALADEDSVAWNKDLARYNELSSAEATRAREDLWGEQRGGMDASSRTGKTPDEMAEMTKAMQEEAELGELRKRLGFVPSTTDRFGKDFVPDASPPARRPERYTEVVSTPDPQLVDRFNKARASERELKAKIDEVNAEGGDPSDIIEDLRDVHEEIAHLVDQDPALGRKIGDKVEGDLMGQVPEAAGVPTHGTVVNMPTDELDQLADPALWDPETSASRVPGYQEAATEPMRQSDDNLGDLLASSEDMKYAYKWVTEEEYSEMLRSGEIAPTQYGDDPLEPDLNGETYSEWGTTGEYALDIDVDPSANPGILIRAPQGRMDYGRNLAGNVTSSQSVPVGRIEVVGVDGMWHRPASTALPTIPSQTMSRETLELAAMPTREAAEVFGDTSVGLGPIAPGTKVEDYIVFTGGGSVTAQAASEAVANAKVHPNGLHVAEVKREMYGSESTQRIYWMEDADGNVLSALDHPVRGSEMAPGVDTGLDSVYFRSRRGVEKPGDNLLKAIMETMDPTPDQIAAILRSNMLSRKGAIATHRVLKRLVNENSERIGKLTVPEYNRLKADIKANGIHEPLEIDVNPHTGEAVASEGFHRWLIAKELGIEEVPVRITYSESAAGPQFLRAVQKKEPSVLDLQAISRERLNVQTLEEKLSRVSDNMPMTHYPSVSHIRAVVRAPVTKGERVVAQILKIPRMGPNQALDLAKFVDELPSRPLMYVPGGPENPADWLDRNTHTISNYLRRAGVKPADIQASIGKLSRMRTSQEFYEVLEHEIFGDGGIIDRSLTAEIRGNAEIRGKIINLHGRAPETRTRSRVRSYVETAGGRSPVDAPVLGVQKGGELVPIPSRPTEFLKEVPLPDVDNLVEATSIVRRLVRQGEKRGVGKVNASSPYNIAKIAMKIQTATLKPLVMLVRLPAMGMRIQLEQTLRMGAAGFRPVPGVPEGWSIFPGGMPIPFTKLAAGLTGREIPANIRILGGLFGEGGWRMIDPDPRFKGLSQLPANSEIGGFLDENVETQGRDTVPIGTQEIRDDITKLKSSHLESHRKELEMAHTDWLDRKIAALGLDVEKTKAWLTKTRRGRKFMETQMRPQLERSTAYAKGVTDVDGIVISIPASEAAKYVEYPNRLRTDTSVGREAEGYTESLKGDLEGGYDPTHLDADTGEPVGYLTLEFNPSTGKAVIREGHHRIGLLSESGQDVPLRVKVVGDTTAVRGSAIAEVDASDALDELSQLGADATDVGKVFDMDQYVDTPDLRMDTAIDAWLKGRTDYLRQITGNEADFLDYIKTGKLRKGPSAGTRETWDSDGNSIHQRYLEIDNDITNIRADLAARHRRGDPWGDPEAREELAALDQILRQRERKLADLMEEYGDELEVTHIRAGDKRAFRKEMRARWERDPGTIPDRIMMEQGALHRDPDLGRVEDLERIATAASNFMYGPFKALSAADRHGTRGSLWHQSYERELSKLKALGYTKRQAEPIAWANAGNVTRDLMYDLNARTSVQRALRDIFWFAPATQEVLYTWLVKIPSESYWPLGMASLIAKGKVGLEVMEKLGIVQRDQKGEAILQVPFMGDVIEKLSGGRVKMTDFQYGKLEGLNLVTTGGGVPGLSTMANFGLGRAALKYGGFFKEMSDIFQPYGPEATLLPAPIVYLHEAVFGEAPPFEPLSGAYQKAQWDRAQDQAIQYSYADLAEDGIVPPRVEDFGHDEDGRIVLTPEEETAFKAARDEYVDELMTNADRFASGYAWTRFLGSTVAPMSLYTTSSERQDWDRFWSDLMEDDTTPGEISDAQRDQISGYLVDHPNSLAFSVFTTKYGNKRKDLPFAESPDDAFYDAYYTGEASTLEPEEFSLKLMATESRRFYGAQLDSALRGISPDMDPWELLTHGSDRSAALTRYTEQWDRYKQLNPDAAALMDAQSRLWAETNEIPTKSYEAERLATTISLLKQIGPQLTGEEGVRPAELKAVQGQLSELYGNTGEFADPSTPAAKAMGYWYENVLDPYLTKVNALYDQATDLQSRGLDATEVYDQIRELGNQPAQQYKGQTMPTVEEVFWGNKSKAEQDITEVTWASRPITWLTDFQRDTVGYNVSPVGADFLDDVAEVDKYVHDRLEEDDVAPASEMWDAWQEWLVKQKQDMAEKAGPEAVHLLELNEAAPIERIAASGYGGGDTTFGYMVDAAKHASEEITAAGYSPTSYSSTALMWKDWFYTGLNNSAAKDVNLQNLLTGLEKSFPMDNGGTRRGIVLYEAIFFGNFNEQYIPSALTNYGG